MLAVALFAILGPERALGDSSGNSGYLTPIWTENVAPGGAQGLVFDLKVVQNPENGEIETDLTPEGCEADLDKCQKALAIALTDPPDIPLAGFLCSFAWYRNLPTWAQVTISGTFSALAIGASVYLGVVTEKK